MSWNLHQHLGLNFTKLPLYMNIYPNTTKESYEECFRIFKQIFHKNHRLIVSDGSQSLKADRLAVFPAVPHQLCKFHKIRNLFAGISKCLLPEAEERRFKIKVIKYSLWLKELIDHDQHILHDDSLIATLNISQICQEKLDWQHLDLLFSKNSSKTA